MQSEPQGLQRWQPLKSDGLFGAKAEYVTRSAAICP
jgi:hypothetical protein